VRHLDYNLKIKYPCHGIYNQVSKSPSVSGEYGVTARIFTPAGTFLGFYMGEVISGLIASERTESQEYMFTLGKNRFIDAKAYDSCFARYYNCAMKASDQNVTVIRLDKKDPQRIICFIANRNIEQGDEFLISYGSAYWERAAQRAPANSPFRRVCNAMLDLAPSQFETLESLYSFAAEDLAAAFGDKSSTTVAQENDEDNGSDSDYMDE
jgi:SET domain-containing protein